MNNKIDKNGMNPGRVKSDNKPKKENFESTITSIPGIRDISYEKNEKT